MISDLLESDPWSSAASFDTIQSCQVCNSAAYNTLGCTNTMPNLHVIIGDSNTRKSSLLRCLTGVGSGNATRYMSVAEASGKVIQVYCMLSALQENYKPLMPAEFIAMVKGLHPNPTDIAFTLRVSARGSYPDFAAYLRAFSVARWPVVNVALLGSSACTRGAGISARSVASVPTSPLQPTNLTASHVRTVWSWA
jgi:hypothetical protein